MTADQVAAATAEINQGSLRALFEDNSPNTIAHPVVQCLQIKPIEDKGDGLERFRIIFSDIQNFIQSMILPQFNEPIHEGKLRKGSIVRLTGFAPNLVKGKKILIIRDVQVLEQYGQLEKIGQPVALDPKGEDDEAKPQPAAIPGNNFYGNAPAQQQRPAQSLPARTNNPSGYTSGPSHANLYPIEAVSPFVHRWTIKVRCTHKTPIKTWHNKNGEGKLFSVNLLDDSGEIMGTGFNAECDALYELFQEGNVYFISSPCKVLYAKKQFSTLNNDYQLNFERDTVVEKAEDENNVPQLRYNFTSIGDLSSIEKDTTIDTIGILKEVGDVAQIVSKTTSKPYDKRDLTLVDSTLHSVRLTIWGNSATTFEAPLESVVAFKGVKVSDFNGRSLSLLSSGSMTIDPDIDEAHKLKGWYDAQGRQDNFTSHASMGMSSGGRKEDYKTIAQVRDEQIGMSEEPQYFTVKATVIYIKQDSFAYPACLSSDCNKKVVEVEPDQWRCERCDKTHPRPEYRYIMYMNVTDHTGLLWLTSFDDSGRLVMGMTADQLKEMKDNSEEDATEAFANANCKTFVFRCRAKMDTLQDQQRVRYQVQSASEINFPAECAKLTELIKQYSLESNDLFVR